MCLCRDWLLESLRRHWLRYSLIVKDVMKKESNKRRQIRTEKPSA